MCQLVLGAGAMQVSGLRSITAKHLALSSQCVSACMTLHPLLRPLLTATLPTPRLGLILPEFDRLLQVSNNTYHVSSALNWPAFLCCLHNHYCCDQQHIIGLQCCLVSAANSSSSMLISGVLQSSAVTQNMEAESGSVACRPTLMHQCMLHRL